MGKPEPNLHYELMALSYKFRDFFLPRLNILKEVGIEPGFHVLDYGCGPESYMAPLAELVGESGKIYALDIHPLAIQKVQDIAARKGLGNIETIHSDHATGLENGVIDVVLLYDTYHDLTDPDCVLEELHRVLKPNSVLSFSDHHMKKEEIRSQITKKQPLCLIAKRQENI